MRSKLTYRGARRDAVKRIRRRDFKHADRPSLVDLWRDLLPRDAAADVRHTDLKRKRTA